jgi:2,5-dihydroxypyridine 5,6-dioxygenase
LPGSDAPSLSYLASAELVHLATEQLQRCCVTEDEHVLIHADSGSNPHYVAAFTAAGAHLGADTYQIVHARGRERSVIDAWKRADLVIDVSSHAHVYGELMRDALLSGTRILRMAVTEDVLRRLVPTQELRERVEAGQRIMQDGKVMRITSPGGTDLTLYKEGRDALGIYSVADKPGRWDIWPAGMVNCAPHEDRGEGVLVLSPGDMMLAIRQYVHEKVYLEVENGAITKITGGMEAEVLKRWFAKFEDPNAYHVAHVGWGCEKRADWMKPGQDNECFYANMQIAFGANLGIYTQAQTRSRAHIDFPCLNNSYWVDDIQIQADGEFLLDELAYKGEPVDDLAEAFPR